MSVRCLEDVWKVSGGRVGDSGYWLVYWISNKNHIGSEHSDIALFFQKPLMRKNTYVWGCLDGVWGCLGGVWECLNDV